MHFAIKVTPWYLRWSTYCRGGTRLLNGVGRRSGSQRAPPRRGRADEWRLVRASTTVAGGGAVSGTCTSPTGLAAEERRSARAPGGAVAGAVARGSPTVSWRPEELGQRISAAMVEGAQGGAQAYCTSKRVLNWAASQDSKTKCNTHPNNRIYIGLNSMSWRNWQWTRFNIQTSNIDFQT
jgi:hypothetical protein